MHPALRLEEVLLNIFGHCHTPNHALVPSMVPVATTCRAFKEPALDVLWGELLDPSPLVRCLPEACYRQHNEIYSFHRSLTEREWEALRSYARRIRSMGDFTWGVDKKVITILANSPSPEPLFPNLRRLRHCLDIQPNRLLQIPFPSLTRFRSHFGRWNSLHSLRDILWPLSKFSPNIASFTLEYNEVGRIPGLVDVACINYICSWICQWRSLVIVACPDISLDMSTLQHLSDIGTLSQLEFALDPILPLPKTPFFFPNLHKLQVETKCLGTVSRFLSQTRLPALTDITVFIWASPSPQEFHSFLRNTHTSGMAHKIQKLSLEQDPLWTEEIINTYPRLVLDDLRPCMFFSDLRELRVDLERNVFLSNNDLLSLASAWPHLKIILINGAWGWNTDSGGITPDGFLQLLQICPSLCWTALLWDVRGHTEVPPSGWLERDGLTLPVGHRLDVIDTRIGPENVPAISALFTEFQAKCPHLSVSAWDCEWRGELEPVVCEEYETRWRAVFPESIYNFNLPPALEEYEEWPDHEGGEGRDAEGDTDVDSEDTEDGEDEESGADDDGEVGES